MPSPDVTSPSSQTMRWKVVTGAEMDLDHHLPSGQHLQKSSQAASATKERDNVVSSLLNELGRPSKAANPLSKKDRAKQAIIRRKKVAAIQMVPNWRRDTKLSDLGSAELFLQELERKADTLRKRRARFGSHRPISATESPKRPMHRSKKMAEQTLNISMLGTSETVQRAKVLHRWLDKKALPLDFSGRPLLPTEIDEIPQSVHEAFRDCFVQVTNQCALLCGEHGKILEKIWTHYVEALKAANDQTERGADRQYHNKRTAFEESNKNNTALAILSLENDEMISDPLSPAQKFRGSQPILAKAGSLLTRRRSLSPSIGTLEPLEHPTVHDAPMGAIKKPSPNGISQLLHLKHLGHRELFPMHTTSPSAESSQILKRNDGAEDGLDAPTSALSMSDPEYIPEQMQIRVRIMAEQAASLRRLRQSIFADYVAEVEAEYHGNKIAAQNKRLKKDADKEEVEVPEILQLTDAEIQAKNLKDLAEKRAHEANERIRAKQSKSLSDKAKKIEEELAMKRACIMIQNAIRKNHARKRMKLLRTQMLMRESRFDFNTYLKQRIGEHGEMTGSVKLEESLRIVEEYVWESKKFIRDMTMDWWKKKEEEKNIKDYLVGQLHRKNELLEASRGHTKHLIKGITEFITDLKLEDNSPKLQKLLLEMNETLFDCRPNQKNEANIAKGFQAVADLAQRGLKLSKKIVSGPVKLTQETQTDGDPNAIPEVRKREKQPATKKKISKKANTKEKRFRAKLSALFGDFADHIRPENFAKGVPTSLGKTLDLITEVYHEKIEYDEVDDRESTRRHGMPEFVHDHMFRKYGLRSLADKHTINLIYSLKQHSDHPKVKLFAQFCRVGIKHIDPLPTAALDFYLYVAAYFHTLEDKYGKDLIFNDKLNPDKNLMFLKSALYAVPVVIGVCINNGPKLTKDVLLDELKIMFDCKLRVKESSFKVGEHEVVDVDIMFQILIEVFENIWDKLQDKLYEFFVQGDTDGDGSMTFDEFSSLVLSLNPEMSENKLHRMFKVALKSLDDPSSQELTPEAFITAALELGFLTGDHKTYMPPRPLTLSELQKKHSGSTDVGDLWAEEKEHDVSVYSGNVSSADWETQQTIKKEKQFEKKFEVHKSSWNDVRSHLDRNADALDTLAVDPEHKVKVAEIKALRAMLEGTIEAKENVKEVRNTLHKLNRRMSNIQILNDAQMSDLHAIEAHQSSDDDQHDDEHASDHNDELDEHVTGVAVAT